MLTIEPPSDRLTENTDRPPQQRRGRLLVVDDEEGPRQSLRVIFMDEFDVLLASDGASAIELARRHKIDVAVLDVRMSGMSGIEVLERLRYVDPDIKAVMMTAFETTDTMRQALRLRACDYINKPFDLATMRAAVANAMQRHTLESELHDHAQKHQLLCAELQNQTIQAQIAHTRGDIYASIIHDINGPLTVISGFVQLMNQRFGHATRLEAADVDLLRDRLKIITRQVGNCMEISRRYLGFLRRQAEDAPLVGVNQLLQDLSHLLQVHPSLQNHSFTVTPLAEDVGARINGTDLIQILLNLAVNAFQAAPERHQVKIEGRTLRQPLDLTTLKDGPQNRVLNLENFDNSTPLLEVSVLDNGPGIPPETLPKIFQPYFTTKEDRQGTGLGLNIVQRLVKEAHGLLHLQTQLGRGTTVTLWLPAARLVK